MAVKMAERYKILLVLIGIVSLVFYIYYLNNSVDNLKLEKQNLQTQISQLESNVSQLKDTIKQSNEEYKTGIDKCNALNKILQESAQQQKEQNNEVISTDSDELINLFNTRMRNIQTNS